MDQLIRAARERKRPRDLAIFTIIRYTGMRRGSVAGLCVRNLYDGWGLRGVPVKGGKTRDSPLPAVVMEYLRCYVSEVLAKENGSVTPDTPLFWSSWGQRHRGKVRQPMTGQNIWLLCKLYGCLIGVPELKPHDLRHGCRDGGLQRTPGPRARAGATRARQDRNDPGLRSDST